MELLLASGGIDFREYKPNTVLRRIERRMQVLHCATSLTDPQRPGRPHPPTRSALLRRELLIPVTRFFRDPAHCSSYLGRRVIPALVQQSAAEPIRVWVACCATGEEAYSMAILFAEAFRRLGRTRLVKIFATDVEQQYLDHAGAGTYPDTIAAEVSAERLQQFFHERHGVYTVLPEIRQMVIFARHNLVADPPFTRMNLVSCRNMLIYLRPRAQDAAVSRLHYALAANGVLFMGPSESLGVCTHFAALPGRHKVYQLLRRDRLSISLDSGGRHRSLAGRMAARSVLPPADAQALLVEGGQALLLQSYAPASLLVNEAHELLHVYGDARNLLQMAEGQATLDVLKLLPRAAVGVRPGACCQWRASDSASAPHARGACAPGRARAGGCAGRRRQAAGRRRRPQAGAAVVRAPARRRDGAARQRCRAARARRRAPAPHRGAGA
ncbi:MAG: CheR family methyltransferase [Burkholderiaceae bacterium]|nr:CheR family methyltransferase [Burkholderiaceae bacterium]